MNAAFPDPDALADWFKQARKQTGLTQAAFGEAIGVTQQAVYAVEAGGGANYTTVFRAVKLLLGDDDTAAPTVLERVQEIRNLLAALDLIGVGIGGEAGHAVSVVALNARTLADNVIARITRHSQTLATVSVAANGRTVSE